MLRYLLCLLPLLSAGLHADPAGDVERVLGRYRQAKAIEAKVKKTVIQGVMNSTSVSEGVFYFAKGKLRLDLETPEKSTLVYDGKSIWVEAHLDENTVQVSHLKAGTLKHTDSLMASLFDKKDALRGFRSTKTSEAGGAKIYAFEPKEAKGTDIKYLEVALKGSDLQHLTYRDQVENTVTFEFRDVKKRDVPAAKFTYHPPKNASVNEL